MSLPGAAAAQRAAITIGSSSASPSVPCITHRGTYPGRSLGANRWARIASSRWLSSSEKLLPMQILGPAANGWYACPWRAASRSRVYRSGSNTSGSSQNRGCWCV